MNERAWVLFNELKSQTISVGILASNWLEFPHTLAVLAQHNLRLLHFDIADGQFSPLFTTSALALKHFSQPFYKDVHLMVKNQFEVAQQCINAGANILTLQIENEESLYPIYHWIKTNSEALCGISICPNTTLEQLQPYLEIVDVIQILTLDPRTGEKMDKMALIERISLLFTMLGKRREDKFVSVDGAMHLELAQMLKPTGIDWVVSGSALFTGNTIDKNLVSWQSILP